MKCNIFYFFFSSRRRHTRWNCDWSSDVCSSDLLRGDQEKAGMGAVDGCDGVADGGHEPLGRGRAGRCCGEDREEFPGSDDERLVSAEARCCHGASCLANARYTLRLRPPRPDIVSPPPQVTQGSSAASGSRSGPGLPPELVAAPGRSAVSER